MEKWLIYTLTGIGLLIISLFFEEARDWYGEQLEEIWEQLIYISTGEWIGDLWDFITSAFEDLSEFSTYGIVFGIIGLVFIYYLREWTVKPFVQHFSSTGQIFWTVATYVIVFAGCYILGKGFENS
jgi:hypothetical protein